MQAHSEAHSFRSRAVKSADVVAWLRDYGTRALEIAAAYVVEELLNVEEYGYEPRRPLDASRMQRR